jgi:hypothetical protein
MPYKSLSGRTPAASYPDMLQMGNDGQGLPNTGVISVCDGLGNESPIKLGKTAAAIDFNGGLIKNCIMQGCCEESDVISHTNGTNLTINLVAKRSTVLEMLDLDATSTTCTSCCSGALGEAGVNNITLNFNPNLTVVASELGYTPKVGCKSSIVLVYPGVFNSITRLVFSSPHGTLFGDVDTCVSGVTGFTIYDIYVIPVSSSYKIVIKRSFTL